MKNLLTFEEVAQFGLGVFIFSRLNFAWWWFPVLLLTPDLSMIGYALNTKIGAWMYNFFHHKFLAISVLFIGYLLDNQVVMLAGSILFAHAAFDRIWGYGLKYEDSFKHTHLGMIGKN